MAFQKFTAYGAGSRDRCTLRVSGYLFVPRAIAQLVAPEPPKQVLLYFDPESQLLALVPGDSLIDAPEELREVSDEPSGIAVNIVPLLRAHKLAKLEKKLMVDAETIEIESRKAIQVDLGEVPTLESGPNRKW